jgi:heme-degrading monooxygenase HmoA
MARLDNEGQRRRLRAHRAGPGDPRHRSEGHRGFRSIDLVRRERDHDVEFMTLMWFDTLGSVKEFTGEDYETAHVPAQARAVLADFDRRSAHYEVLDRREQPG